MIDWYDWSGGREAMLRFGPASGPVVVVALPLFEEANRTRTFAVALMRLLAERGIASALPDLPGTGESLVQIKAVGLPQLHAAYQGAVDALRRQERSCYALSIRSGALIDAHASVRGRWHFSPQPGADLMRELKRIALAPGTPDQGNWWSLENSTEIAGNRLSSDLLSALALAQPYADAPGSPLRTIRYDSDPRPADLQAAGTPLWRRAEPDHDPALAALLADDIAAWIHACEG
ncbi:hypothetical protein [Sphingomonas sp. S2-65]|uniref:hypothetical protein n=1 Tax=Sphingomonas sp. S2-65 TaxID=2903960 RepID=UPI001F470364|nr:hypothetical protein [Sphingomonas sp. S2-65]UYY58695.1 hypothetical protein LZ586_00845 [Sphingomonas sp. S2-65]